MVSAPSADGSTRTKPAERRPWAWVASLALMAAALLFVLTTHWPLTTLQVIDGFPVWYPLPGMCSDSAGPVDRDDTWSCEAWRHAAASALDAREPGHAPIIQFSLRGQDQWNPAFFPDGSPTYGTGPFTVMVMKLADGSVKAVGIGCNPGGCGASATYHP